MVDRRRTFLAALGLIAALSTSAFATEREIQSRAAEFKALIHADGTEKDGADNFIPAAGRAAMMYDKWVPADYRRSIGPGDAPSRAAAKKLAASARRFLGFIDKAPWDESLRSLMLNEVRQSQVAAIKDWDRLVRCVEGTTPAPASGPPP